MGFEGQDAESAESARPGSPGAGGMAAGSKVPRQRARGRDTADLELVERMRRGMPEAYDELYRRHADAVRRYARTCCRDADTADDLTNEVFAATLQAVRRGTGPETAVRAYLLTSVRRVAADWARTAKREQLVEDFATFAVSAAAQPGGTDALDQGAEVRAMRQAEQSMAVRAFRSLPERWQTVLWHTTVEDASPRDVAPLLGLTPNATAVLAHRAREGLRQAYLQEHVSRALTEGGECARYADRLGAYARGGLRTRAERGLRKHLAECARCETAASEVRDLNEHLGGVLPIAIIGWFVVETWLKGAAVVTGTAGAGAAGAAGSAAATGGGSATAGAVGGAVAEGLGAPVKAGLASGVLATAVAAAITLAMMGGDPDEGPQAAAPPPEVSQEPRPVPEPAPEAVPEPAPDPAPASVPRPELAQAPEPPAPEPAPESESESESESEPTPSPEAPPAPEPEPEEPTPEPPPAPAPFQLRELEYGVLGDGTDPAVRLVGSSPVWQRDGLSVAGRAYAHGITVSALSSVTIDLNRPCVSYRAWAGLDDLTLGIGAAVFSVYGDDVELWTSPLLRRDEPAVPVNVPLTGVETLRLTVRPESPLGPVALVDWAESEIFCE
ncbi:sigma-70 family RNA polymerase sigma factor [Streptomyces sp. NBC_01803]|uniref:sigma-70 family RNA polymerase sigma factor n=1 Tax=Streptomyces sp. NBC_01803 TaxID=2975946 RepID=UPI002DDC4022|nr:sigma-70 family RNA polymerase sigma factor [Streptomyces sp. NBC_01803]WSA44933.1 sigma-70 family RNA polymerase sigma factor [Streptomyces sp. NBC_01803]